MNSVTMKLTATNINLNDKLSLIIEQDCKSSSAATGRAMIAVAEFAANKPGGKSVRMKLNSTKPSSYALFSYAGSFIMLVLNSRYDKVYFC